VTKKSEGKKSTSQRKTPVSVLGRPGRSHHHGVPTEDAMTPQTVLNVQALCHMKSPSHPGGAKSVLLWIIRSPG
jgi:hypothetical protein